MKRPVLVGPLALGLALLLVAPRVGHSEDAAPKPANPPANPPPGDKPADKPKADDPKPAPGNPKPAPGDPKPVPGEGAPAEPPAPAVPAPPAPSGMVWVDVTTVKPKIGSTAEEAFKLGEKRSKDVQVELSYEVPLHEVALRPFFLDQFEVTNAQYLRFLDETCKTTYKTGAGALATLEDVASYLAYGSAKGAEQAKDTNVWSQLYELNKPELLKTPEFKDLKKDDARKAPLPPDLELKGYKRRLPRLWFVDSDKLEGDSAPNHPVRDVSYLDAEAFAEWAGKHVPTEEEFEWAIRGPQGFDFPWGNDWAQGVKNGKRVIEQRCNWVDLGKTSKTHEPMTVAVDEMPESKSWCGAFHLIGNASEWTSSWFDPYPGWPGDPKNPWASYHDRYVRVIRGGSCADRELIGLRAAHRNFIGVARLQPPQPGNHFDYTGFRCAQYLTPSYDRLEPAIERLLRPKKIRRENVATDRYAGAAVVHFAPAGTDPENHVHVTGASSAILFAPLTSIWGLAVAKEAEPAKDDKPKSAEEKKEDKEKEKAKAKENELRKPEAKNASELKTYAPGPDDEPAVLGIFHTDIDLAKVKIFDAKAAAASGPKPGARRGSKGAGGGPPPVKEGDLARDTYVLGLAHGMIGVYRSNLDLVALIDKPQIADVVLKKGEQPPASSVEVEPDADLIRCHFWIAVGGKGTDPNAGVLVKFSVGTVTGQLDKARAGTDWR